MKKAIKVECYFLNNGYKLFIDRFFYYDFDCIFEDIHCNRLPGNYFSIDDSIFTYK